jgi:ribokinase
MIQADVVVVGGSNVDYLIRSARHPAPGETVVGETFQEGPGGKGANQALGAARLGAKVALLSRLGVDARADTLHRALIEAEVDVSHVSRDREQPTGVALVLVDHSGSRRTLTAPGANHRMGEEEVEVARELIAFAKVVVAGLDVPLPAVAAALRLAKAAGAKTVLDPAPPLPLSEELLRLVDVIRADAVEAEALTNVHVRDVRSAAQCGRVLVARGVGAAIIRAGDAGDLVVTREEQHLLPELPSDCVDSAGEGDAFVAGLAAALAEGRSLIDAASFGSAAAAFATTRRAAQAGLPRREDLISLLREHRAPTSVPV